MPSAQSPASECGRDGGEMVPVEPVERRRPYWSLSTSFLYSGTIDKNNTINECINHNVSFLILTELTIVYFVK